jgi:hypothetical protein
MTETGILSNMKKVKSKKKTSNMIYSFSYETTSKIEEKDIVEIIAI